MGGAAPNAGFTQGTPWLPLADDWRARNVAEQDADASSMLALYRKLIGLRQTEAALNRGEYQSIERALLPADVLAYARTFDGKRLVVLLNFSDEAQTVRNDLLPADAAVLLSTHTGRHRTPLHKSIDAAILLGAFEGVIVGGAD